MVDIRRADIRKVDLNLLVVFDVLLRLQSVTRAAGELGMSQPAMSLALNKLRKALGDPLFVRGSRGLSPTRRAETLAVPLRQVLDQIRNDVLRHPSFDPATTERTFTFNMADVGELVFLPRIRAHLQTAAPGANIRTSPPRPAGWRKRSSPARWTWRSATSRACRGQSSTSSASSAIRSSASCARTTRSSAPR